MKSIYTVRRFPHDRICTNAGFEAQPEKETIKTASWLEVDEKARSFMGTRAIQVLVRDGKQDLWL